MAELSGNVTLCYSANPDACADNMASIVVRLNVPKYCRFCEDLSQRAHFVSIGNFGFHDLFVSIMCRHDMDKSYAKSPRQSFLYDTPRGGFTWTRRCLDWDRDLPKLLRLLRKNMGMGPRNLPFYCFLRMCWCIDVPSVFYWPASFLRVHSGETLL